MNTSNYLEQSKITLSKSEERKLSKDQLELLHAILGMTGEMGEIADQVKKHIIYGKELDKRNLLEECGDVLWFMSIIIRNYNSSFENVMAANIEKLKSRYPEKFSIEKYENRDLEKEAKILDKHLFNK